MGTDSRQMSDPTVLLEDFILDSAIDDFPKLVAAGRP